MPKPLTTLVHLSCVCGQMSQLAFDIALDCEQDPAYPVYVDASVIMGMTHTYNEGRKGFDNIEYMMCRPETQFFPDLSKVRYTHTATAHNDSVSVPVACHALVSIYV